MGIIGEVLLIAPIGVHHVDSIVPIPTRREGNLCLWGSAYHQRGVKPKATTLDSVDILVSRYESRPTGINGCHNGIRVPIETKEE